jgi:hypothetical protein
LILDHIIKDNDKSLLNMVEEIQLFNMPVAVDRLGATVMRIVSQLVNYVFVFSTLHAKWIRSKDHIRVLL